MGNIQERLMKNKVYDAAILGAGAAGLAAACKLSAEGLSVALIEKNHRVGRKILSTGAGKCNISNRNISADDYICSDKEKLSVIFKKIAPEEVHSFLSSKLGIMFREKEDGRLFPYSMKAETAVFAFERFLKSSKADIFLLKKAVSAKKAGDVFEIETVPVSFGNENKTDSSKKEIIRSRKLIIACGGPSYPRIGGCADGFMLAEKFGHSVLPLKPLLTSFSVKYPDLSNLDGVRVKASISAPFLTEKIEGEILFTAYGISGDAAIDLSFLAFQKNPDSVFIDMMPDKSEKEITDFFSHLKGDIAENLSCSLDRKLVNFIAGFFEHKGKISGETALKSFAGKIKKFEISGLAPMGFEYAMAKTGGVPLREIDADFMSLKQKDLFLVGETLDCAGRSGGYNLHFAFTSAISCAKAAAGP